MRSFVPITFAIASALACLPAASAGTFAVMSYNVRGLPPLVIGNRNDEMVAVAPLLEEFHDPLGRYKGMNSLVGLQEVFSQNYHKVLMDPSTVSYEYRTVKDTGGTIGIGDGINILSDFRIEELSRTRWDKCHGSFGRFRSDCDTNKGFLFARVLLEQDLSVDVYTLHTDAGQDKGSRKARRSNIRQLVRAINERSPRGTAVIVLGDTNSLYTRAGDDDMQSLLAGTGVKDVWVELRRGGVVPGAGPLLNKDCPTDPSSGSCELVDKIFYRDGETLAFVPQSYQALKEMFSDAKGRSLSDHDPVAVTFHYSRPNATECMRSPNGRSCDDRAEGALAKARLSGLATGHATTATR